MIGGCGAEGGRAVLSRLKRSPWRTRYYAMQQALTDGFPRLVTEQPGQAVVGEK